MMERCTVAVHDKTSGDGIFYMNFPIIMGENIFICGKTKGSWIKIGLTNKGPSQSRLQNERWGITDAFQEGCCYFLNDKFYACISLNKDESLDASLELTVNDGLCHVHEFPKVSFNTAIWLVFMLYSEGHVQISDRKITDSADTFLCQLS